MRHQDPHPHHPAPPRLNPRVALFLDFDGTITDLAPRPGAVRIPGTLRSLLTSLDDGLQGALALVTGRRLAEVDDMLVSPRLPGAGVHGAELRRARDEDVRLQWRPDIRGLLRGLQLHFAGDPRILVEDKTVAVALHYRLAPERASECHRVMHALVPRDDFGIMCGHHVIEARPRGASKGRALQALMQEWPFAGRTPVYVGDDNTDEDGFAAAAELGGFGVKVGAGTTLATFRCDDVASVHAWLQESVGELTATRH